MPIFCPLLLHKLYKQFGLLEEAGAHEKCKKHTFFGQITILEKNVFNKNCSQLKNKKNQKNYFPGIPDPDFYPDSTFSGFFEFFATAS